MFERLKRWARAKPKPAELPKLPGLAWIPPDKNPWHVPVLDVRSVTQHTLSASTDPKCAANAVSFGHDDGVSFATQVPEISRTVPTNLQYRIDRLLAPGALFVPRHMEDQWAIYFHSGRILCIRSWSRKVVATAEIELGANSLLTIPAIHGALVVAEEEPDFTVRALDFLLRSHALRAVFPAPLPSGMETSPEKAALWCMSAFGRQAAYATSHTLNVGMPQKPLRTFSLMHFATARGDIDNVEKWLNAGLPIDLLAADGLAPLHWAVLREDTLMAQHLLNRGAHVDVRGAQGETPLMVTAQEGNIASTKFLVERGADVNATDLRGFISLHRAIERGQVEMVKLLLNYGARPDVVAEGYTPLAYAERLGHVEIAKVLKTSQALNVPGP